MNSGFLHHKAKQNKSNLKMNVSLIIPVFNGLRYLKTLKETLNQIYRDDRFEIIIIDDGSDDNLSELLRTAYPNINYYYQSRQGSGIARNLGIEKSRCDWIMFMDVDDIINIPELNKALSKLNHNVDVFCFQAKRIIHSPRGVIEKTWKPDLFNFEFIGTCFQYPEIIVDSIVMNKIFNRDYLCRSRVTFPKGKYEDKIFLTNLFLKNPTINFYKIPFYRWMVYPGSGSQTNTKDIDDIDQRFNACAKQLILSQKTPFYDVILSNVFNHDITLYSKVYHLHDLTFKRLLYKKKLFFNNLGIPIRLTNKGLRIYNSNGFWRFNLVMRTMNRYNIYKKIMITSKKCFDYFFKNHRLMKRIRRG